MDDITEPIPIAIRRGPVEHERRAQIIEAARQHFRADGYDKTSVADLAKAIGVSSAYIYRFFDSKQSIGEAACSATLAAIGKRLLDIEAESIPAAAKIERFYSVLLESGYELLIKQRKMHELVACAVSNHWDSVNNHRAVIRAVLRRLVVEGRERGEFERKTPLDEVVLALAQVAVPFAHPKLLEQRSLKDLRQSARAVSNLALRGLSP